MKLNRYYWRQQILTVILIALVATMLFAPIASNSEAPYLLDYFNHLAAIAQAKLALIEGQFPLRVAPTGNNGWRYPYFQFYSPLSYTIAGLIYRWLTPTQPFLAYKITIWCAAVIGGIYMNRLTYWFTKSRPVALLTSVAYLTAPYYIITIDHLGGFNEAIALGMVPVVLYYTWQRFFRPTSNVLLLQTSLAWFALATIHLITFAYLSFFLALLLLLITLRNPRHWLHLVNAGIAYGFGCLLAMWYLAPAILLGERLVIATTFADLAQKAYGVSLAALLSPTAMISDMTSQSISSNGIVATLSLIHPNLSAPILLGVAISLYAVINRSLSVNKRFDYWLPFLLIMFIIAFIIVWTPINFWQWLPTPFGIVQYSWRLLSQAMWIGVLLFAWALCWLFKNKLDARHVAVGIVLITFFASTWFSTPETKKIELNNVISTPYFTFNADAYLLDPQKNGASIALIDHLALPLVISGTGNNAKINLDAINQLSPSFTQDAFPTHLVLEGQIASKNTNDLAAVTILLNDTILQSDWLKPGPLHLDIPFSRIKKIAKNNPLLLQLKITKNHLETEFTVSIKKIFLAGFLRPAEVITATNTAPLCHQQKAETVCTIATNATTRLIELPTYYYPKLLNITVNGKITPYFGIRYGNRLITGIPALPGQVNHIQIQFRGLLWANTLSMTAWYLWGIFFVFVVMRKIAARRIKTLPPP